MRNNDVNLAWLNINANTISVSSFKPDVFELGSPKLFHAKQKFMVSNFYSNFLCKDDQ